MKKLFIFTLMVIGYMSFTLSTNPPISSSTSTSEFNSQAASTVNSGAVNSALFATQASNSSFRLTYATTMYVDPNNGQLYAAGQNGRGGLGLGYDEEGNGITANQQSFTPLYKSGDASQPFINPIDWDYIDRNSAIIDADGKVWTAGQQNDGQLGNGYISTDTSDNQYTLEAVVGLPEGYTAVKVSVSSYYSTIIMLDDGTVWGAGHRNGLGLSATGGVTISGALGGGYYPTFTQISGTSDAIQYEMPFDAKDVVDFKGGDYQTVYLLEDGSLYRCNANGYALVSTNVVSFDNIWGSSSYLTSNGDVYYSSSATAAYTEILSVGGYEGTIDSIYSGSNAWAYLTTEGDVYYSTTSSGTDLFKIAEDVICFDLGGYNGTTFGAITKSGEFKLWGADSFGSLGNGTTEGGTTVTPDNALDQFEESTPSTPTTDGNTVTPPSVDPETGELQKDEDGNNVAIIPTLSTPAPAF